MSAESKILNPKVAIVGRPNVGKSTLFNILTDSRKSVVKDQAGVTRDIIIEEAEVWGKIFDLIDTGGITEAQDVFSKLIREQVIEFLDGVDLLLVVMDGRAGLIPEDRDIMKIVAETGKEFLLVVNKVDRTHDEELLAADFYEFGENVVTASFEQRRGLSSVLEWLNSKLPEAKSVAETDVTLAIVGKPNAGKSSLVNYILGERRMIVSEIAGTTVDSVDSQFIREGKKYTIIDTAGLRKKARREEGVEVIAAFKSNESIRKSDIILLVIDGLIGPTEQDAKILEKVLESHRGVILVVNKTDVAHQEIPEFRKTLKAKISEEFHFYDDIPVVFVSAKTGHGMEDLLEKVNWMHEKLNFKISTGVLNDFFSETIRKAPSPVFGVNNVKFYYLTQTHQTPPSFIAFANHPEGVDKAYRRFLTKNLKVKFELQGIPIRIFVMKSGGNK